MPILHKVYGLYKLFYQYSKSFPKKDRYSLGLKCSDLILEILELILSAIENNREEKMFFLKKTSVKLNILRIFIRLTKEVEILDFKKYLTLQKEINEIGKMLGSWIKRAT